MQAKVGEWIRFSTMRKLLNTVRYIRIFSFYSFSLFSFQPNFRGCWGKEKGCIVGAAVLQFAAVTVSLIVTRVEEMQPEGGLLWCSERMQEGMFVEALPQQSGQRGA